MPLFHAYHIRRKPALGFAVGYADGAGIVGRYSDADQAVGGLKGGAGALDHRVAGVVQQRQLGVLVLAGRFGAGQRGYAVGLLNGRHFHRRDRHSAFVAVLRLVRTVRQIKAVKIPAYVEFFVLRIDQL